MRNVKFGNLVLDAGPEDTPSKRTKHDGSRHVLQMAITFMAQRHFHPSHRKKKATQRLKDDVGAWND